MSFSFQAEAAQSQGQFEEDIPVPAGQHTLVIFDHAYRENAKQNGHWLRLHFEVKGGAATGQTFVQFYNVQHQNETAEKIAKEELSRLCHAGGIDGFSDPEELIGLEFDAVVKIRDAQNGEKRNEIDRYLPSSAKAAPASAAPAAQSAAPAAAAAAAAASEKRPWEK